METSVDILDELKGQPVEEVCMKLSTILGRVEQVPEGTIVAMDFDLTRTRVWYDVETQKVTKVTRG